MPMINEGGPLLEGLVHGAKKVHEEHEKEKAVESAKEDAKKDQQRHEENKKQGML
jgi:hypothetical protein